MSVFVQSRLHRRALAAGMFSTLALAAAAAGRPSRAQEGTPTAEVLSISAIPDQDVTLLNRQYGAIAEYLTATTGLTVEYVPMVDYAALVTAFARGDIQLAWFGGLTGVQAQAAAPDTRAIVQRPRDAEFHSRFIARSDLDVETLQDLKGLRFTFGSESSTSGHLMPRYFLVEAGIDPESDFQGLPNYSGSHDKTIALVESGAFDAGALNEAVWEQRLADGEIDTAKVRDVYTTPAYYDYHWGIRGDVDALFGDGATDTIIEALLSLDPDDPDDKAILGLFSTDAFIPTENANYDTIRDVAEQLGILR